MTELLEKYFSARKNTCFILITLVAVVFLLMFLLNGTFELSSMAFWGAFVLFFVFCQRQLSLREKKRAVIRDVTEQVARKLEMQCKEPGLWDEKQCKASLFFPPYINGFHLEQEIPYQLFTQENQGTILQYHHVSFGESFARVKKIGKQYVVRGRRGTPTAFKITSQGLLFNCSFPFHFSDSWLLLPREWGKHLEKITCGNFLMLTFHRKNTIPENFSLFKNENDALWIYSTAGSAQEAGAAVLEEGAFVEECYAPLREKPYSFMSFTGKNMYVYIPFEWKMRSEEELEECVAEYKADIELVRKIVFDDVMPGCYEKQFAAMNGEQV